MAEQHESQRTGLNELSTSVDNGEVDSGAIAQYYDQWAAAYDGNLRDWDYQAPKVGVDLLHQGVPLDAKVLDAGCGTGLSGLALQDLGYQHITGVDISQASIDLAKQTSAYEELAQVDMQSLQLPYEANEFAGLQCVGVLTYVPDTDGILREFCRVVRPGGLVVFTQRDDLFAQRKDAAALKALEDEGLWAPISVSEPQPYLPENDDYGDKVHVIYCAFRVV
jgi:predicted TPR repeat methyltransferase